MASRPPSSILAAAHWALVVTTWCFAAYSLVYGLPRARKLAGDFGQSPGPVEGFLIDQAPWLTLSAVVGWLVLFWYGKSNGFSRIALILIPLALGLVGWGVTYLVVSKLIAAVGP